MKKTLLLSFALITAFQLVVAQTTELLVKSSDKGLYLDHKVTPKENFYSVARLYNAHPKEIAAFNGLDMSKGLSLGQTIRIPLTSANFSQSVNEGIPVYYKVGEKEGLMKVSNANNKVSLESLRRWNNLSGDDVNFGSLLIVGFLTKPMTATEPVTKNEPAVNNTPVKNEPAEQKKEEKPVKTEPVVEKQKQEDTPPPPPPTTAPPKVEMRSAAGYFETSFRQQVKTKPLSKTETVTAGIFKTSSGWDDLKYYLLMDGVEPGTIVRIVNPDNKKTVFAKVLGEMSSLRQQGGPDIRISNAAAAALIVKEQDKFIVKVSY